MVVVGALVLLAGCEATSEVDESRAGLGPRMGMTHNGLDPRVMFLPEVDDVLARPLAQNDYVKKLLGRPGGKFFLYDAAKCALPWGTRVSVQGPLGNYTLEGLLGLAPAWATRAPTPSEKGWITACLLAHLNGLGETVSISVRGANPGISPIGTLEAQQYSWQEAGFWGEIRNPDVLADDGSGTTKGHQFFACYGAALEQLCVNPAEAVRKRICAQPGAVPNCKVTVVGPCGDFDGRHKYSCGRDLAPNGFTDCHREPSIGVGVWRAPTVISREVITTYLPSGTLGCPGE
jgi:hypothetical protein